MFVDLDRLKHSYAVAKKMVQIGEELNLDETQLKDLFIIGFNHDIGYEYTENGKDHNIIGGLMLKESGFKYWKEVYYHGILTEEYSSLYLEILNSADMQIDKYGNDVGYESRLEDIKSRYGDNSKVYIICKKLVDELVEKGL